MGILIGTDEAGYGPNLGPLTLGITLWEVPNVTVDLYHAFESVVSSKRVRGTLMVADSKDVYHSGQSIETLEETVLAFLSTLHQGLPERFQNLADWLGLDLSGRGECYGSLAEWPLPVCASPSVIAERAERLENVFRSTGCRLGGLRGSVIFPSQFNDSVDRLGNKAELLSFETLTLVSGFLGDSLSRGEATVLIGCDKHGGRSKYAGMLNQYLTTEFVHIERESMECSEYRWQQGESEIAMHFRARGETFLPIALSSMIAKYLREICMNAWNAYWQNKIPGIKPTKGYPVDARRFKKAIAERQAELGISDRQVWRCR